jgi:hypothetical protein
MKNLIFSSVGDNTNFSELWIGENMNYDIYVVYYGSDMEKYKKYKSMITYIERRNGSKFQNFKYVYETNLNIIQNYEYCFIIDDDIIINVNEINKMFFYAAKYKLDICSPSFSNIGKISHLITAQKKERILTYTNYIEVTCPLFHINALHKFMPYLDKTLIGWGIDYLFMWCNGLDKQNTYAIIHEISCINPQDNHKSIKRRELSLINEWDKRESIWIAYANTIQCPVSYKHIEYKTIKK